MKKTRAYRLTLTEDQLRVIKSSLESYSRMAIGQFKTSLEEVWYDKVYKVDRKRLEAACDELKELFTGLMSKGASYGIHQEEVREEARIAYDLNQVIRHRLAYDDNPKGGNTVNYHEPLRSSTQPLPIIECKEVDTI
jgi:hypothetical protein